MGKCTIIERKNYIYVYLGGIIRFFLFTAKLVAFV